jgi:uncharacterized protein YqeY
MSLLLDIKEMQLRARVARNIPLATLLTTLYSEAANTGLNDGKRESTDSEVISTISKFIKNCYEILSVSTEEVFSKKYRWEISVLEKLLPTQLGSDEIYDIVRSLTSHGNGRGETMGTIQKYFKTTYPGQYEGAFLSLVVQGRLKDLANGL